METTTVLDYLAGDERAIAAIARHPDAVWIGLLFVIAAGFARVHAKKDLTRKPFFLLTPLLASLISSTALFALVYVVMSARGAALPPYFDAYRSFLGVFWMTAPLAFLYAIPFERFASRTGTVRARLWTLGVVSTWRVGLMIQVLRTLLGCSAAAAVVLVMLFADVVALVAMVSALRRTDEPGPQIIEAMGSIGPSGTREAQMLRSTAGCVSALGLMTLPVWVIGAITTTGDAASWRSLPVVDASAPALDRGLLVTACLSIGLWIFVLPFTQRKQRLRSRIEALMAEGRVEAMLLAMSSRRPGDFPAHWTPPIGRRFGAGPGAPNLLDIAAAALDAKDAAAIAPWVRQAYEAALAEYLDEPLWYWFDDRTLRKIASLLERIPEGPILAARLSAAVDKLAASFEGLPPLKEPSEAQGAQGSTAAIAIDEQGSAVTGQGSAESAQNGIDEGQGSAESAQNRMGEEQGATGKPPLYSRWPGATPHRAGPIATLKDLARAHGVKEPLAHAELRFSPGPQP